MHTRRNLAFLTVVPMVLMGCEHALWGNGMALGMSVLLFVGTLQLGRMGAEPSGAPSSGAEPARPNTAN